MQFCSSFNLMLRIKKLEVVAQTFSLKNVFLEISQNSQENTCARVSILIKLQNRDSGTVVFL